MKYIITESKLEKVALSWMNKNFHPDNLEIVKSQKYPNLIFYRKDGNVIMEQDLENKYFWFHYDKIWSIFEKFFNMEYREIRGLLKVWLEETFKLEGYKPFQSESGSHRASEEIFKLN